MGRDKKNELKEDHYTKMIRRTMHTLAWRELSTTAQAIYPWLKFEWKGVQNNNNGKISLSVRDAARCINVSINTAAKAFHDLQKKGFLVVTEAAHLGVGGEAKCPRFELTELPLPGETSARKLYLNWRTGKDYPVVKATIHNPSGRNGR